jgi:hypothetical protein
MSGGRSLAPLGRGLYFNKDVNRDAWHRGLRFPANKSNYAVWKGRSHAKIMPLKSVDTSPVRRGVTCPQWRRLTRLSRLG